MVGAALALAGAARARLWAGIAGVGLFLAWFGGVAPGLLSAATGGIFRYPQKLLFWFTLGAAVAAGLGLRALLESPRAARRRSPSSAWRCSARRSLLRLALAPVRRLPRRAASRGRVRRQPPPRRPATWIVGLAAGRRAARPRRLGGAARPGGGGGRRAGARTGAARAGRGDRRRRALPRAAPLLRGARRAAQRRRGLLDPARVGAGHPLSGRGPQPRRSRAAHPSSISSPRWVSGSASPIRWRPTSRASTRRSTPSSGGAVALGLAGAGALAAPPGRRGDGSPRPLLELEGVAPLATETRWGGRHHALGRSPTRRRRSPGRARVRAEPDPATAFRLGRRRRARRRRERGRGAARARPLRADPRARVGRRPGRLRDRVRAAGWRWCAGPTSPASGRASTTAPRSRPCRST